MKKYDAVVVGSGPNGFSAAILMQQVGLSVLLLEAEAKVGGGARSEELTLPGFVHDIGSAIHPMAAYSPFFNTLPLQRFGLSWIHPDEPLSHPLDDGQAVLLRRSVAETAAHLGRDEQAYIRLMQPLVDHWDHIAPSFLGPLRWPDHPIDLAKFGLRAVQPATLLAKQFKEPAARALLAGLAGHSVLPLEKMVSAGVGLVLGALGHVVGWPFPRGGAQSITNALQAYFTSIGGEVETERPVASITDIPPCKAILFDITPWQLLDMQGFDFTPTYRKQLAQFIYGPGIFKIDWALSDPIPFKDPACNKAATIHLGGTLEEIAESERLTWKGKHSDKPYVLVAQHSPFDATRAPEGKHTGWAYCHVPRYSEVDMTSIIEDQVERFAPGFKDTILEKHTMNTRQVHRYNRNYIGGDINGGAQTLFQIFTRPVWKLTPYRTSLKGVYLCSSSTPPGGAVHGMCGYHAGRTALKDVFGVVV